MNAVVVAKFLDKIDKGDRQYIDVRYDLNKEAYEAAKQRSDVARFTVGHEGAFIEVDLKRKNDPNLLLKEML